MSDEIQFDDPGFDFFEASYEHRRVSFPELFYALLEAEKRGDSRQVVTQPSKRVLGFANLIQKVVFLVGIVDTKFRLDVAMPDDLKERFGSWEALVAHLGYAERRKVLFEDTSSFDPELKMWEGYAKRNAMKEGTWVPDLTPEQIEDDRLALAAAEVTPKSFKVTEGIITGEDMSRGTLPDIEDNTQVVATAVKLDDGTVVIKRLPQHEAGDRLATLELEMRP